MKLVCFTYAGGNSSFFDCLKKKLCPEITVIAMEYAGHGKRHKIPFCTNFKELAEDMYNLIEPVLEEVEPYAIMGYSMGSISAIEVLKEIMRKKKKLPAHLFLSAHEPCTKSDFYSVDNINEYVKQRTIQFGAVPEKLIHNDSFWRMYLPIYKADYSIISKYNFETLNLKSDVRTTVFYSESDTPLRTMQNWNRYFDVIDFVKYPGNHFFIKDNLTSIAEDIKKRLV